jgi:tetratricopeptide (TPR) repeat protein
VILATVRSWHDRARVRATLARIARHPLAFHADADPLSLALTPGERAAVAYMREARPIPSALFQQRLADEEAVSSLVYALAVTRQFAFKGQRKGPMGGRGAPIPISIAPPTSARGGSRPAPSLSERELSEDLGRLSALPGMFPPTDDARPEDADGGDSGSRTQPNVWPPNMPGSLSERPVPVRRTSSEIDNAERALEAMTHFRLAESALQRGDFDQAERLAGRAAATDPEQADYLALHAWARAAGSATEDIAYESLEVLSRLLSIESDNERALLYRGKLNKRIGRLRDAVRDLERLVQINPRQREAATELRLLKQKTAR